MRTDRTGGGLKGLLLASACVAGLSGCEVVDYIELVPASVTFKQPNNSVFVEAKCMARTGVRALKAKVAWSVKDPEIATVDEKGKVTPVKSGHTEVIAKYGDIVAAVPVEVLFVEKMTVEPLKLTMTEGDAAVPLNVKAFDYQGRELRDRKPTVIAKDRKVVAIVAAGTAIMPLDPGETTVDVQVEGKAASVTVVVEADKKTKK